MSQRDISEQIKSLYDVDISPELVSKIIVHQIRSSTRFVRYKDIKPLMTDLKKVYTAVTEDEALENLVIFKEKWGKVSPSCVKSWEDNWDILSTLFAYPTEIQKIIYTTNIIEGLNRQFRQIAKNKPSFTNDDSLRKCSTWPAGKLSSTGPPVVEIGI